MAFRGETQVRYIYGLINLQDFPRLEGTKEVKGNKEVFKVPEDIEVQTVRDGKIEWLPVESFHIHKDLEMVEVKTHTSRTVHCSKDHSLVTVDAELNYTKAVPAVGMTVPRLREPVNGHAKTFHAIQFSEEGGVEVPLDEKFGYLNGCFIGDGWTNNTKRPWDVMLANVSPDLREEYEATIRKIAGGFARGATLVKAPHEYQGHQCYSEKLTINCLPVANYFRSNIGHGAQNKHLPEFWVHSPAEFRWGLLAGLIDTDGSVSKVKAKNKKGPQTQVSFHTTSRRLAYEVVGLAHSLDLTATCSFSKITNAGNESWIIMFNYESIGKMQGKLQLRVADKASVLAKAVIPATLDSKKYTPNLPAEKVKELARTITPKKQRVSKKTGEPIMSPEQVVEAKEFSSLSVMLYRSVKQATPVLKSVALRMFDLRPEFFASSEFWSKWRDMVLDTRIDWELVTEIRPIPEITEAYDLTIPPAYTMVTESGIVVYDTMQVHLPVSDEAIKDALNMMPSKLVFSERVRGNLLTQPAGEPIAGLYKATQNVGQIRLDQPVKKFNSVAEAWKAYHAGKLKMTDYVEIAGR